MGLVFLLCYSLAAPVLVHAQDTAPREPDMQPALPDATAKLIERARIVLDRYYTLWLAAFKDRQVFNVERAWRDAAKKAEFDDWDAFEKALAERRKNDPRNFPLRYEAARREISEGYIRQLSKLRE